MQCVVVLCIAIAAFGIGAIDGLSDVVRVRPRSPLPLDMTDEGLSSKIVGGYATPRDAFPFVAYVRSDFKHLCTGTLVHPRWLLTVGCLVDGITEEVVLGNFDRKFNTESMQIFRISKIVKLGDNGNSALFKLSSRADVKGQAVGTVDLVSSRGFMNRARRNELDCVQLGWGYERRDNQFVTTRRLRATAVNFVNDTEVERRGYGNFLRPGLIATEAVYTNNCEFDGMCYGDNGGPVICKRGKKWIQTGAHVYFSSLDGCMTGVKATKNVLDIYDWVQSTISGQS